MISWVSHAAVKMIHYLSIQLISSSDEVVISVARGIFTKT